MELTEAKKIIEDYKAVLNKGTVGETVLRKVSFLPYSKGKIKYAYFVLIENVLNNGGGFKGDQRDDLTKTYSELSNFIDDATAEKYAKNYSEWQVKKSKGYADKKDEALIKQYIAYTHFLKLGGLFDEINDFIEELLKK